MRCDYAALARVSLSAVRLTGGVQLNANSTQAILTAAIAAANAAIACPSARALTSEGGAGDPPPSAALRRHLQSTATAPWSTVSLNLGVGTSAAGAAAIAQVVLTAPASAFPLTTAAWAPLWGFASAAAWQAAIGSPLAVVVGSVANFNAATYSPVPAPTFVLSSQQQLGLGLGIGLSLAAIIVVFAIAACAMTSRFSSRAAKQLRVVGSGVLSGSAKAGST